MNKIIEILTHEHQEILKFVEKLRGMCLDFMKYDKIDTAEFYKAVNFIKTKASLAKNFHIQPSELDSMPMWEYELFISELNNQVKEENEQQQKEMDKYNIPDPKKLSNPSSMMKSYSGNIPKIPKVPKF